MAKLSMRKLSASSLLEVLIAMTIIMAVFVMGMFIYARVTHSQFSTRQLVAQQRMQAIIQDCIDRRNLENKKISFDSISYLISVQKFNEYPDLRVIHVTASQNGDDLGELRKVVKFSTEKEKL